jgi:hypothetical protein
MEGKGGFGRLFIFGVLEEGHISERLLQSSVCLHMSGRAERCRKKHERHWLAVASHDVGVRKIYLDLAHQWRELAEQAELLAKMQARSR